jgi:NAD(P)-dependent dehydrogenase (short-subunit alcohol dehydrogenase family)
MVADTTSDASVRDMVTEAVETLGGVDILVNCAARPAGTWLSAPLAEITNELFETEMNTKVMGYLRCAREVVPHMSRQGWGRIINVSGLAGRRANGAVASMRNVAVVAMTKNLARELGPQGINVTVVHPGLTYTERIPGLIAEQSESEGIPAEEIRGRMAAGNFINRMVDAGEVAHVIVFLASPKSVAINGDLVVAGGGVGEAIYY